MAANLPVRFGVKKKILENNLRSLILIHLIKNFMNILARTKEIGFWFIKVKYRLRISTILSLVLVHTANLFRKYQILDYGTSQSDSEFVVSNLDSHEGKSKCYLLHCAPVISEYREYYNRLLRDE